MYLAICVTLLILACLYRKKATYRFPPAPVVIVMVLLFLPFPIDGITSYMGFRETTNLIRYVTGYGCGTTLGILLFWALHASFFAAHEETRLSGDVRSCLKWLLIAAAVGAGLYLAYPFLGLVGALLCVVAILSTFTVVVCLILACVGPLMARIPEGRRLAPFMAMGLLGTFVLLFLLTFLKLFVLRAAGHVT